MRPVRSVLSKLTKVPGHRVRGDCVATSGGDVRHIAEIDTSKMGHNAHQLKQAAQRHGCVAGGVPRGTWQSVAAEGGRLNLLVVKEVQMQPIRRWSSPHSSEWSSWEECPH